MKATLAFGLSVAILFLQASQIRRMHLDSLNTLALPTVYIPANPIACYHSGSRARLAPPTSAFLWGFSLNWAVDLPLLMRDRLGSDPIVIFGCYTRSVHTSHA